MKSKRSTRKVDKSGTKRLKPNPDDTTVEGTPKVETDSSIVDPVEKSRRTTTGVELDSPATSMAVADHAKPMAKGRFNDARKAFHALLRQPSVTEEDLMSWMEATFGDPAVAKYAEKRPQLFVDLVWAYREMVRQTRKPAESDPLLERLLSGLTPGGAATVGAALVAGNWDKPELFDRTLRAWLAANPGAVDPKARPGLAARLLNMLWNAGDAAAIATLVASRVDTSTASYVDIDGEVDLEGFYNGYVEPLEHLLGKYLHLVDLLHPAGGEPLAVDQVDEGIRDQLTYLGAQSPGDGRNGDENLAEGRRKVARAAEVLDALAKLGDAKVLTSYAEVKKSGLYAAFRDRPGTIWGFEHVRFPFVYAVHNTDFGKHPVRMWEMWAVVDAILDEKRYLRLLMNPEATIKELVNTGKTLIEKTMTDDPVEYAGVREAGNKEIFLAAFEEQCTAYLQVLAGRAPAAKFATASIRGNYESKYLGTFGCKAGLWWAQQKGIPVYYCLDGVRDEDVIAFKTNKTDIVNEFLSEPGKRKQYVEVITLAEVREILLNWTTLKSVVKFSRRGEFLSDATVEKLKADMEAADIKAKSRQAPLRTQVIAAAEKDLVGGANLPDLTGPLFVGLTDEAFHKVVAQLLLLNMALLAASDQALSEFLNTKGAAILYDAELLPYTFDADYKRMVAEKNPTKKAELGRQLEDAVRDREVPPPLHDTLITAIRHFSGQA
jgi:hypothetical protein